MSVKRAASIDLDWDQIGDKGSLSKTTKLTLLDSLLQEVCIKSGSQPVNIPFLQD